jgi:hypothetical protein
MAQSPPIAAYESCFPEKLENMTSADGLVLIGRRRINLVALPYPVDPNN